MEVSAIGRDRRERQFRPRSGGYVRRAAGNNYRKCVLDSARGLAGKSVEILCAITDKG